MEHLEHATNVELLATIAGKTAAEALLQRYDLLSTLAQVSFDDLQQVRGVGKSKAAAIKAAFLLAQRMTRETYPEAPLVDTPERVADLLREENRLYTVKHFQAVFLNTRRRLIGVQNLSQGTADTLLLHPRELFRAAIAVKASSIVLVHNNPCGDPSPTEQDIKVTRDLIRAGQILKIDVLDHVILGIRTNERPRDDVSLRELGFFQPGRNRSCPFD